MEGNQDKPKYPTLDEFGRMTAPDKKRLFLRLPVSAQKLLIGISAFAESVQPKMAQKVGRISSEEFEEAQKTLIESPFLSLVQDGRLEISGPMKEFINTDLKQFWEGQKKESTKSG